MLKVNGTRYKLTDREDREKLHRYIDQWVMDNYPVELLSGGLEEDLFQIHEYVSTENRKLLEGKWFREGLVVEYWYEPLTKYLNKVNIDYDLYNKGTVGFNYKGKYFVFTRNLEDYDVKKSKGRSEWEKKEDKVIEVKDGLIKKEQLERLGLSYVKDYYLPKDNK